MLVYQGTEMLQIELERIGYHEPTSTTELLLSFHLFPDKTGLPSM